MCLSLCVLRNYFRNSHSRKLDKQSRKHNLTRNYHSTSFEVIHFGISENPTTDCVSLYNSAGLISKVSEEIASDNAENCRCRQLRCRLMPPHQATRANIRINLVSPENSHLATFLPLIVWVYLHSNFCGGLRKTHLFCIRMLIGCSVIQSC